MKKSIPITILVLLFSISNTIGWGFASNKYNFLAQTSVGTLVDSKSMTIDDLTKELV
jgi:hypothetical protein